MTLPASLVPMECLRCYCFTGARSLRRGLTSSRVCRFSEPLDLDGPDILKTFPPLSGQLLKIIPLPPRVLQRIGGSS